MEEEQDLFETLPNEAVFEIMLNMKPEELLNFCKVRNRRIRSLCADEIFWKNKVNHDYQIIYKPKTKSWYDIYIDQTYNKSRIPVFYKHEFVGYILVSENVSLPVLFLLIKSAMLKAYPNRLYYYDYYLYDSNHRPISSYTAESWSKLTLHRQLVYTNYFKNNIYLKDIATIEVADSSITISKNIPNSNEF